MEPSYDEDLNENSFFQLLQTDHAELFEKATLEGWTICVPRAGSTPRYTLAHEDFYGHVLVPSDELPESHFRTLSGRAVRVSNRLVTVEHEDIARPLSTHILFEETFYTEDLVRYKVLCVESPLVSHLGAGSGEGSPPVAVHTLRECIDLLWTECSGKDILERMDAAMGAFRSAAGLDSEPLQAQKDRAGRLYVRCLQLALEDPRLKEQAGADKRLLENVKLAVETYVHHGIYRQLFEGIAACTAYEDASLNKVIRNLSDIQLRDLDVRPDLCDTVPRARQELSRVDAYSTTLGKMGCLRRMVSAISKQSGPKRTSSLGGGNIIAADDLLPMIVFLVIKTALPNWIAHLTYMKHFHFSVCASCQVDEYNFLITTLEAAIEHIKSGVLLGNSAPEAQFIYESQENRETPPSDSNDGGNESDGEETCIGDFFESIKQGNIARVEKMLKRNGYVTNQSSEKTSGLCHPLCSCDRCESVMSRSLCDTAPTVRSCDDKGFTALHVACLFGQPMIVDLLVSAGADANARDCSGSVPLHYCAARGYQNALLLLIHAGARLGERDSDGNTPLHLASNNGHEGCVKALLYFAEHVGARLDTNVANKKGDTALHFAARWGYEGIVEILLEHGASCAVQNRRQLTPTDCAHSLHISKLLLSHRKADKLVPTQVVVRSGHLDRNAEAAAASKPGLDFVDAGRDGATDGWLGNCDRESLSAHMQSTEQIKKVEKILKAIAQGDTRLACFYLGLEGCGEDRGSSGAARRGGVACHPLCRCETCGADADRDEEQGVRAADVNVCNPEGVTPLHAAAAHGRADLVRLLLERGARADAVTRARRASPLHLACQHQQLRAARLLLQAGCSVDLADARGNTALHYCSDARLVRLLLAFRPRLDAANAEGRTPLQQAEERMSLAVVALLRAQ
ncbi:ankyrin repeat domain-containing protein 27 [Bacillus rossius redtenbacheri]|uniref:ankyrin repeat domain-containing protein 27 n=1 Tax=Bacillus rossius redtenbacheri TaxID=93214 RepID=UPI002FDEB442